MPRVSIILPTYNRADVLERAVGSVVKQTFEDWELFVIDDGSTDGTEQLAAAFPPKVHYVKQRNGGCYVARNNGLSHSTGDIITFLDSDDEWLPEHLELVNAFFSTFESEHYLMTEFWSEFSDGERVRNDYDLFANRWPAMARTVGTNSLDLPEGESDPYLRVYRKRERVEDWGRDIVGRLGHKTAHRYHGSVHSAFRWGHMGWLPTTAITRHALHTVGPFREDLRSAADYTFLATLSRHFEVNVVGVPTAVKYETNGARELVEGHLATGRNAYRFATTRLMLFEEEFGDQMDTDPELQGIHGLYHLFAGRTALRQGMRTQAISHLERTVEVLPRHPTARYLLGLARSVPSDEASAWLYRNAIRVPYILERARTGDLRGLRWIRNWIRGNFASSERTTPGRSN